MNISASIANSAQNLLCGGKYELLPRLPPKRPIKPIIKLLHKIGNVLKDIIFIMSIPQLACNLFSERLFRKILSETSISPLLRKRLTEMESRIQQIAKIAGFKEPNKLKVLSFDSSYTAAAIGSSTIIVSIEELIQPEDLPQELHLQRLTRGEITEEEWVVKFKQWKVKNFSINIPPKIFTSQAGVDYEIAYGKAFLKLFKDTQKKNESFDAIICHELGHCIKKHTIKIAWAEFGWKLLGPLTLGISSIFEKKILASLSRRQEKEADLFSAEKIQGAQGLINFFHSCLEAGKSMHHKYPERTNLNGDNLKDKKHPALTARISYLSPLV